MPVVTTKQIMLDAQAGHYAVGAFNAENMEMVLAIIAAAEEARSPVIIQTTPSTLKYADPRVFAAMARAAAADSTVPVAIHLDHGDSFELAEKCLRGGYTSIMIDGSKKDFDENIALSARVVELCHSQGIPVEAELGKVGGKEDSLTCDTPAYTDPDEAAEFVARTGIDSLAVAIGTAHGIYKGEPHVDTDRLAAIREKVFIPLVLHGTSGVPADTVRRCVSLGICKVNYATDLRIAYTAAVREYLDADAQVFDPKKYGKAAMQKVSRQVIERMELCGSIGKAP